MTDRLRIGIAQLNPVVGDIAGNIVKLKAAREELAGADLIVYPELFLSGYPPEDLVMKPVFVAECRSAIEALAAETAEGSALLVGTPWAEDGKLYNAVALLADGAVSAIRYKADLPNYDVFDEKRVFDAGPLPGPVNFKDVRIGVPICEDIWSPDVVECLEEERCRITTGAERLAFPSW